MPAETASQTKLRGLVEHLVEEIRVEYRPPRTPAPKLTVIRGGRDDA